MRALFLLLVLVASAPPFQDTALIPAPYLSPQYLATPDAPSSIVVAGEGESGERLVVTGQALDGTKPVAGVSVYVFHTDSEGLYARDGDPSTAELNPRLHGAMRTDTNGRYRYETIRPGSYNNNASHVHYIVRAPGYKPRLLDLWFEDDPILAARRKAGEPAIPAAIKLQDAVAIRPVTRDANGIWHATRDLEMTRE